MVKIVLLCSFQMCANVEVDFVSYIKVVTN